MKVLIKYDDILYLVPCTDDELDLDEFTSIVNHGSWPDECVSKEELMGRFEIISYFTDESNLLLSK